MNMELTRRSFLVGAAALGGTLGLGTLASCSSGEAKPQDNGTWDKEADLVVVGGGTGQAAAIAGAAAGMSVILIEARDMVGGAMAYSGGNAWLANTSFSQENGDSYEFAKKYLDHMQMGMDNEELVEAYLASCRRLDLERSQHPTAAAQRAVSAQLGRGRRHRPQLPGHGR